MITLAMLAIVGVGAVFVVHNARRSVLEEVRSSVNMALQLIDAGLSHIGDDEGRLLSWLAELAHMEKTRHLRIHVSQLPEKIIKLDAPPATETGERPPSWFVWAVTPQQMVGEKRLERQGGKPIRILIQANPADEIAEAWNEAQDFLRLIGALAVAVYALVHISLGRAFRSVGVILQGLEGIEQGDFNKRLPRFSLPEFDRISQAFNHTAETLARAQAENRALTQQSLLIQEEERRYLAQELHDELGQSLSAIKLMAGALRKPLHGDPGGEAVETIIELCDRLVGVVRGLMRRMRPMLLDEFGLVASLEEMIEHWRDRNLGVQVDFECEAGVEECAGEASIHLFRIVQECLTNTAKYAKARHLRIHLSLAVGTSLCLEFADDGIGFDPRQPPTGFGLLGMKERANSLGGVFALTTRPGGGVKITVQVPCRDEGNP